MDSKCRAKNPATCRKHGITRNEPAKKLTIAEEIERNFALRRAELDNLRKTEVSERVEDWNNLGFLPVHYKRLCENSNVYRARSLETEKYLTEEEKQAIKVFSSNNYKWINRSLYNSESELVEEEGKPLHQFVMKSMSENYVEENPTRKQFKDVVNLLDSAFAKVQKPEPEILYRGQSLANPAIPGGTVKDLHAYVDNNFKLGKIVKTKGYLSTSPVAFAAMSYCGAVDREALNPRNEGILFELKTNKGLDVQTLTLFSRETETMLPRGLKWRVVAVHKSKKVTSIDKTGFSRKRQAKVTLIQLEEVV